MIKQNKLLRKAQKVKLLHRGFRQHLTIERSFYMISQMFTQYVCTHGCHKPHQNHVSRAGHAITNLS